MFEKILGEFRALRDELNQQTFHCEGAFFLLSHVDLGFIDELIVTSIVTLLSGVVMFKRKLPDPNVYAVGQNMEEATFYMLQLQQGRLWVLSVCFLCLKPLEIKWSSVDSYNCF